MKYNEHYEEQFNFTAHNTLITFHVTLENRIVLESWEKNTSKNQFMLGVFYSPFSVMVYKSHYLNPALSFSAQQMDRPRQAPSIDLLLWNYLK